jgi:hypothetical protein
MKVAAESKPARPRSIHPTEYLNGEFGRQVRKELDLSISVLYRVFEICRSTSKGLAQRLQA